MHERINSVTPGNAGSPKPKNPKRPTQANIAISITTFMPNRFRKNGMSNMHNASAIYDSDTNMVALLAANESAYSAIPLKLVMNGVA